MKTNQLEKRANKAHLKYRKTKEALILKVPTPILYTAKGLIAQTSTVDYTGLLDGGTFLAFDAKETAVKTSFPLANIHDHQLQYLEFVENLGGIGFFLIHFKKVYTHQAFVTPLDIVKYYWYESRRKSIPIDKFKVEWLVDIDNYLPKVIELFNIKQEK